MLHKEMGIPEGQTISLTELMAKKTRDKRTGNTAGTKRDTFAVNARKWNHG